MLKLILFVFSLLLPAFAFGNGITFSFSQTSGNSDTSTFSLSYSYQRPLKRWELSSDGSYLYKRSSGKEVANRLSLNGSFSYSLTSRFSLELRSFVFVDPFSGYDFRGGLGPGVGYLLTKELTLFGNLTYTIQ
ncbi:DUF481 domain-containing protein [Thermovibrio sp.]